MACRVTGRNRLVVCDSVAPSYRQVIATYCQAQGITIDVVTTADAGGVANEATAGIVAQYPNFFGTLDDLAALGDAIHGEGGLLVVSADPLAMGMLRPPGAFGADIVAGEGQPLGIPPSFGGPYLGLFSCKQQYIRQMPSRLVGRTTDTEGRTGYVLTLQTREQHIRRNAQRPTSVPTKPCTRWRRRYTWQPWVATGSGRWQSCATTNPTTPPSKSTTCRVTRCRWKASSFRSLWCPAQLTRQP
ncbi:Probable glycine dehydrogenase (decarboxylating) subunit 1 [Geodia barretti]|nr:Probable glycine dehydrogenase (decarboxylating) subunit 1 [Geodia barretti]